MTGILVSTVLREKRRKSNLKWDYIIAREGFIYLCEELLLEHTRRQLELWRVDGTFRSILDSIAKINLRRKDVLFNFITKQLSLRK
jgi:hypothetical protein